MVSVEDHLRQWSEAGIVDAVTSERIRSFERSRRATTAAERPSVLEILVYLGVAVIGVGVFILVSISWEDLEEWARVAVTAGPGLFALLVGQVMRSSQVPGLQRGGQMAWLAGSALLTGGATVVGVNSDWADENVALGAAITALAITLPLWAIAPSHPQIIGLAAALFLLSTALGSRQDEFSFAAAGISLMAFGWAGVLLVERGVLVPPVSARALSAVAVGFGAFWAAQEAAGYEPLAFIAAAGLLALGIWRSTFMYVVAGVALVFLALISTITRHIDEPSAAAAALILLGALLVAVVLGLARWQPWKRATA
ncbi:MAG: hypothetical protein C0506_15985 [Anaerolinea sp.]|nr:hypothetical protein [Anaerolinea sp.]